MQQQIQHGPKHQSNLAPLHHLIDHHPSTFGDSGGERGLAMIHVSYRAHVEMWLRSAIFCFDDGESVRRRPEVTLGSRRERESVRRWPEVTLRSRRETTWERREATTNHQPSPNRWNHVSVWVYIPRLFLLSSLLPSDISLCSHDFWIAWTDLGGVETQRWNRYVKHTSTVYRP